MSDQAKPTEGNSSSRRQFLRTSSAIAGGALATGLAVPRTVHAAGDDMIKIGLVGCGGRGTGAAAQAMNTKGPTKLIAVCDAFGDRMQGSLGSLKGRYKDKVDVPKDRQFTGFDGYKKLCAIKDIDLVIFATPPHFRPMHVAEALDNGKHVFMEKPCATDAPGVRLMLDNARKAKEKNLALAVGLQRHHEARYKETIKRLQDGAIGDINLTRAYWNGGGVWTRPRKEGQTEMEYQMRNWYYFNWLCGDHITEQHIHNLDVINWLKNGYPVKANAQGGRQVRTGLDHGEIYDHHFVEFTYADGSKMYSQCRHIRGCWNNVSEHAHGSKGTANIGGATIYNAKGEKTWSFGRGGGGGHQQEHHDLFAALRKGERPNEGEYGALSTMTSLLGRMASYSGREIGWDAALASKISLGPTEYDFKATPPVVPDAQGRYKIPTPGKTKTV
jgi:myo-inositol 2-dehydrogenase/D-chiro-inositol 1-dehydrogenase